MQVTDAMVAKAAESDAEFDGRTWLAMPKSERERYMERSRRSLTAALAEMWRPIDEAPKDGRYIIAGRFRDSALKWVRHSRRMTCDEAAERDGGEPEDYDDGWTDGDDEDDYCEPTHFMPLPAPPMGK